MKRILLAEFMHETNTFLGQKTTLQDFRNLDYAFGEEILTRYAGVRNEMGGFIDALRQEKDIKILPAFVMGATPGGIVEQEVFELAAKMTKKYLMENLELDGILLSVHGAMVTEKYEDGEGELLRVFREIVGPKIPVFLTLDLHTNITKKMLKYATALFPCDFYPHTDLYDKGLKAAKLLVKTITGEIKPVMAVKKIDLIFPIMPTSQPVMQDILGFVRTVAQNAKVLNASIAHGFCCADIFEAGAAAIVITDGDAKLASNKAEKIAKFVWDNRTSLKKKYYLLDEALAKCKPNSASFYVFADVTDNPGGGTAGDGTNLLRGLLNRKIRNVAFASIFDPDTVAAAEKCGVGNTFRAQLGGRSNPEVSGYPIVQDAYVKSITDGKVQYKGIMDTGCVMDMGPSAVLVIEGIEIIVISKRMQPRDIEIFRANGINPYDKRILVTKSSVHYRATYEAEAEECFDIEVPGEMPQRPEDIHYCHVRRPIYPLDEM